MAKKKNNELLGSQIVFCEKLSQLLDAGMNLYPAIEFLVPQIQHKDFQVAIQNWIITNKEREPELYSDLYETLELFPDSCSPFLLEMLKLGEKNRKLSETLHKIAMALEKELLYD
jgi:type II secretory pathway component PulF